MPEPLGHASTLLIASSKAASLPLLPSAMNTSWEAVIAAYLEEHVAQRHRQ
jgi:hypothetical protein